MLRVGSIYKHFKGGFYRIAGLATHTETDETMVRYSKLEKVDKRWFVAADEWVRPKDNFLQQVSGPGGTLVDRFTFCGELISG